MITLDQLRDAGGVLKNIVTSAGHRVATGQPITTAEVKSFASAVKDSAQAVAAGESPFVPQDVYEARLATCRACPTVDQKTDICVKARGGCNCFVPNKCKLRTQRCPQGKWNSWTPPVKTAGIDTAAAADDHT